VLLSSVFKQYELSPLIFPASLTLFGTLAAAFVISSVHIGRKARMPRAARNVLRSWLSREIFLLSAGCALFLAAAGMYFFRDKYEIEPRFITYAFWLASAVGLLGLFSMQRVYLLRSVRLWTGPRSLSMVFSSTFLLGTLEAVLILHIFADKSVEDMLWRFYPVFFVPLLFDAFHVHELMRLGRQVPAWVLAGMRVPVYLGVLHFAGRMDITKFAAAIAFAFLGDIILRLFFFGEQTTSFQTEMASARRLRLTPYHHAPAAHLRMLRQRRGQR
jgi:DMSO reductase anchor subunit